MLDGAALGARCRSGVYGAGLHKKLRLASHGVQGDHGLTWGAQQGEAERTE